MKNCPKCSTVKSLDLFYRSKDRLDGRTCWCKDCMKASQRSWAMRNPEKVRASATAWGKRNPEKKRELRRRYSLLNKDKELAYARQYRLDNMEYRKQYDKKRRAAFPEKSRHWSRIAGLRSYGLTPESYDAMFKSQSGACAICRGQNLNGERLAVDHDHKTGTVRALLCQKCNKGIGLFNDSPDILTAAWAYLVRHLKKSNLQEAVK